MKRSVIGWNIWRLLLYLVAGFAVVAEEPATRKPTAQQAVKRLIRKLTSPTGMVRPPYQPARYDLGLLADIEAEDKDAFDLGEDDTDTDTDDAWGDNDDAWVPNDDDDDSEDKELTLATLKKHAAKRQDRLERLWTIAATMKPRTADERADLAFLRYAFTGEDEEQARKFARQAGFAARMRLAQLQLAECRYAPAIRELIELAGSKDTQCDEALVLLVHHAEARKALAGNVQLLPLPVDLDAYLARRAKSEKTKWMIEAVRRHYRKAELVIAEEEEIEEIEEVVTEEVTEADIDDWPSLADVDSGRLVVRSIKKRYLQTVSNELELNAYAQGMVYREHLVLNLRSVFHGRLQFRLYRFADEKEWRSLSATQLAGRKPLRSWSKEFQPVRMNNRKPDTDATVKVDNLKEEGFYLVTCEAPFAPMIAGQKFVVSRTALYVRTGRNQTVVTAVDRRTGQPVPYLDITLSLSGKVDASRLNRNQSEAFRAGFIGGDGKEKPEQMDLGQAVKWAREYAAGRETRRRFPDIKRTWTLKTQANGVGAMPLDLGDPTYHYALTACAPSLAFSRARVNYQHEETPADKPRGLLWTAQPIYRPGATVRFKGILRKFNGRRLAPADPKLKSATVEVVNSSSQAVVWKQTCMVSKAGTVKGEFQLSLLARLGAYRLLVNGESSSASVEFTVKEFRLPTFKVDVDVADVYRIGGQRTSAEVEVEYANGRPAAAAKVELTAQIGSRKILIPPAYTRRNGKVSVTLPQMPAVQDDQTVYVTAVVMDAAGQSYQAYDRFYLRADAFVVHYEAKNPRPGKDSQLIVTAQHWGTSKPISGAKVFIDGHRKAFTTDQTGRTTVIFRPEKVGGYEGVLQVLADDNVVYKRFRCRVEEETETVKQQPKTVADKEEEEEQHHNRLHVSTAPCSAGKELEVRIDWDNIGNRAGTVLVFCENTAMRAWRALTLKPGMHRINIPTDLDFAPQTHVTVCAFTGNDYMMTDQDTVRVIPVQRFLNLVVAPDKQTYRPGERCNVKVSATDWRGRPVANAEVSLGVVDRAIYWLRRDPTPDLANYFHRYSLPRLPRGSYNEKISLAPECFWKGPKFACGYLLSGRYGGRTNAGRRMAVSRYGGGGSASVSSVPLRTAFRTEAFWVADLLTDRNGEASASFVFPDGITQWRFTARGITADNLIGNVKVKTETALPLHVDLVTLRGLRVGDDVQMQPLVWNRKDEEKYVSTSCQIGDGVVQTGSLTVPAEGSRPMTIAIHPTRLSDIPVEVSVADNNSKLVDRVRTTIPVLPRGYRVTRRFSGAVKGDQEILLDVGSKAIPGSMTLTFRLESGTTAAVQSALDGLIDYPYGCVEQTMSRFLPAVVASEAMRKSDLTCARAKDLPDIIEKGMKRLLNFQHRDGGWGWWKTDKSNVFMTAYVLEGLSLCRQTGAKVPERVLERAEEWLERQFYREKINDSRPHSLAHVNLKIYVAHALANRYAEDLGLDDDMGDGMDLVPGSVVRLYDSIPRRQANGKTLSARDEILRADTLRLLGFEDEAKKALAEIAKSFNGPSSDRADQLAAANLIEVGMALKPGDAAWFQLGQKLVQIRRGSGWGNTLMTASVVRGLTPLVGAEKNSKPKLELKVADKTVATLKGSTGVSVGHILKKELVDDKVVLHTVKDGGFWSAELEAYVPELPRLTNPEAILTLTPKRVRPELTPLPVDKTGTMTARKGETIELELACELTKDISYTRLTIPRPCGVQFLSGPKLVDGIVAVEQRDDAFHIFIDSWAKGKHVIKLTVRSEVTGTVFAPAPELAPMYDKAPAVLVNAPKQWKLEPRQN